MPSEPSPAPLPPSGVRFWAVIGASLAIPLLLPLIFHRGEIMAGKPLRLDMWLGFGPLGVYLYIIGSQVVRFIRGKNARRAVWLLPPVIVVLLLLLAPKGSPLLKLVAPLVGSYAGIAIFTLLTKDDLGGIIRPAKK